MQAAAQRFNADPVIFGATFIGLITITVVLLLIPLRTRSERRLQIAAVSLVVLALAAITTVFAFTLQSARSARPKMKTPRERMAHSGMSSWTIVHEISPQLWTLLSSALCWSLYLHCAIVLLISPTAKRTLINANINININANRDDDVELQSPPSIPNSATTWNSRRGPNVSADSVRCDFNRVWVNFLVLVVSVIIAATFAIVVATTRHSIPTGNFVSQDAIDRDGGKEQRRFSEDLLHCACTTNKAALKGVCLNDQPRTEGQCTFALARPETPTGWKGTQMWECVSGKSNLTAAQESLLAVNLDICVHSSRDLIIAYPSACIAIMAIASIILGTLTASGRPLVYIAGFVFESYLAICILLFCSLPLLLSFRSGTINAIYSVSTRIVFLAVATGPASLRLVKVGIASLLTQICVVLVAGLSQVHQIHWNTHIYTLLGLERNKDDYERDREDLSSR